MRLSVQRLLPFSAVDRALVDDNRAATFALVRAIAFQRILLKHPFLAALANVGHALVSHAGMIPRSFAVRFCLAYVPRPWVAIHSPLYNSVQADAVMDSHRLALLWKRMENAKLQLDHCHNYLRDIQHDTVSGAVSGVDGNYAHLHGLKAEELAIGRYLRAMNDYKAALLGQETPAEANDGVPLTQREREVLALIASGKSSREIAEALGIAFKTVATHRYRLQRKLNAHHTADLTRIAIRRGLTQL